MFVRSLKLDEIKKMEIAGRIVADTLTLVGKSIRPGIETIEIDKIAEDYIRSKNAYPAFKNYNGFPNTLCISIDEEIVHGIPSNRKLEVGQIVSIDCGAVFEGYYSDSAVTFPVVDVSEEKKLLLKVTEEALFEGIAKAVNKGKLYDISRAIQTYCEKFGYSLTRELTGHGIGKKLHQNPSIPNFVPPLIARRDLPNIKLENGYGLAIEPMVHMGAKECYTDSRNGWTVITKDGKPAAHFEHTVIINDNFPLILTLRN